MEASAQPGCASEGHRPDTRVSANGVTALDTGNVMMPALATPTTIVSATPNGNTSSVPDCKLHLPRPKARRVDQIDKRYVVFRE